MPRKLKTYVTTVGFFEQAIAAPSMKAALEAWGSKQNLFHQGFAKETDDPEIIAATMEQPGVVLKRPVGSDGPFEKHAKLPDVKDLNSKPLIAANENKKPAIKKPPAKSKGNNSERERKAAEAYERGKKLREKQREKEEVARREQAEKQAKKRQAAIAKAESALEKSQLQHEQHMSALETQLAAINKKIEVEEAKWNREREQLEAAIEKARDL